MAMGIFLFLLGVLYLQTALPWSQDEGYAVYGAVAPEGDIAGLPIALRVTEFEGKGRAKTPPRVSAPSATATLTQDADVTHALVPSMTRDSVLELEFGGAPHAKFASLRLDDIRQAVVRSGEAQVAEPEWDRGDPPDATPCPEAADPRSAEESEREMAPEEPSVRAWLMPSGGMWIAGLTNDALVSVREEGEPMGNVLVTLEDEKGREYVRGRTDARGLASLELPIEAGIREVQVRVGKKSKPTARQCPEPLESALTRFRLDPPLATSLDPAPHSFDLHSYAEKEPVYCDVWLRGSVVWATAGVPEDHQWRIEIPPLPEGLAVLQCRDHPSVVGAAGAAAWIATGTEAATELRRWAERSSEDPTLADLGPISEWTPSEVEWAGSFLRPRLRPLALLVNTAQEDAIVEAANKKTLRQRLLWLFALGAAAMAIWMLDEVRRHYRKMQTSYDHAVAELGADMDGLPAASFARQWSPGHVVAIAIIVVLNAVGLVLLLDLIL